MKRMIGLLTALLLSISCLAGCGQTAEPIDISVGGMKGPTSMGMVKLMDDAEAGETENTYTFTVAASADELVPLLNQGKVALAAVPANLASVLYHNTDGGVKLLAINTLGVLSIVENGDSVQSFADLKGKTIYATGKGSTPEYALRYLLTQNGLDPDTDISIEWKSEPTEVVALLSQGEGIGMLPQPFVTVAQTQIPDLRIAIDLNEAWTALDNGSLFLTGVLVGRTEFVEEHPAAVSAFLEEYAASVTWVNENPADAAPIIEEIGIVKAAIAEKAIPYCNITCITGEEMQTAMEGYLTTLLEQNPKSIGGSLPGADFYATNEN